MFKIINNRTNEVVGQCKTIKGARKSVDRKDMKYGCYCHSIVEVLEDGTTRERL